MSKRDKELMSWFKLELKWRRAEICRVLVTRQARVYAGINKEEDYFRAHEMLKFLQEMKNDTVKAFLFKQKLKQDYPEIYYTVVQDMVSRKC